MKSIRDIYKIGRGPSSSHTMGPERAARLFLSEHPEADRIEVVLYGSLCKTGVGHGTDRVLREVLQEVDAEIVFSKEDPVGIQHPNTMDFFAYQGPNQTGHIRVESVGGGDIVILGLPADPSAEIYPENSFAEAPGSSTRADGASLLIKIQHMLKNSLDKREISPVIIPVSPNLLGQKLCAGQTVQVAKDRTRI